MWQERKKEREKRTNTLFDAKYRRKTKKNDVDILDEVVAFNLTYHLSRNFVSAETNNYFYIIIVAFFVPYMDEQDTNKKNTQMKLRKSKIEQTVHFVS